RGRLLRAGHVERGAGRVRGQGAGGEAERRRRVPPDADGVPGRAHLRHPAGDEVLPGPFAAEWTRGAVLRVQHAVPRWTCEVADAGGVRAQACRTAGVVVESVIKMLTTEEGSNQ